MRVAAPGRGMRRAVGILAAMAGLMMAGCATRPDPAAFVQRYMELHRSGDVDGLLAMHADNAEFVIDDRLIRGMAGLRDLFEWDAAIGSKLVAEGIRSHGDTIILESVVERSEFMRAFGIPEMRMHARMLVRKGRIAGTYVDSEMDLDMQQQMSEQFMAFMQWLREQRPDDLERLMPAGEVRQNGASAPVWLDLLAQWNNDRGSGSEAGSVPGKTEAPPIG